MIYRHTITSPASLSSTKPEIVTVSLWHPRGVDLDTRHDETTPSGRTVKGRKWRGEDRLLTSTYKRGPQL